MKKIKSILCMLVLMCSALCLYACKGGKDDVTLTSASTNLKEFYYITESIDWTDVKVTAKYSDKSTKTLTKGQFDIPVEEANADTEWVLDTNGLKEETAGSLTKNTYNLKLYVVENQKTYPFTIIVNENESLAYKLEFFTKPSNIAEFEENLSNNGNGFKTTSNAKYYVGDDNPFDITPNYKVCKIGTNDDYDIAISLDVAVYEGQTKVGDSIYSYADGKIDFTEEAIDKEYTIKIKPTYFDKDSDGYDIQEVSFNVTVKDGYNAYDALDLGMMSIAPDGVTYSNYKRYNTMKILYDESVNQAIRDGKWAEIWAEHLKDNGYDDEDIYYVKGIFIHNNINIEKDSLPQEFYITKKESNDFAAGKLRDWTLAYYHMMQDDFVMEGNYFTIDASQIPVNGNLGCNDPGNDLDYYDGTESEKVTNFGHSKLFNFAGMYASCSTGNGESNTKIATVKNINAIGNTGGTIAGKGDEIQYLAGALAMFQNLGCGVDADNLVIKNAMMGWFTEVTDKEDSSNNKQKTQEMSLNNMIITDCFNSGIYNWGGEGGLTITNSELRRFGGPAIFCTSWAYTSGTNKGIKDHGVNVAYDDSVIIDNPVEGTEAWFVITLNATTVATTLKQLNTLYNAYGKSFLTKMTKNENGTDKEVEVFNLKVLIMDNDYLEADDPAIYATVTNKYDTTNSDDIKSVTYDFQNPILKTVNTYAPFIWTNTNDMSYYNGTKLVYPTTTSSQARPSVAFGDVTTEPLTGNEVCMSIIKDTANVGIIMGLYDYNPLG